jgi:hypothetical protein
MRAQKNAHFQPKKGDLLKCSNAQVHVSSAAGYPLRIRSFASPNCFGFAFVGRDPVQLGTVGEQLDPPIDLLFRTV